MAYSIGTLEIVVISGFLIGIVLLLALKVKLANTERVVGDKLQHIEAQLQEYKTYTKYLRNKVRAKYVKEVGQARNSVRFIRTFRLLPRNPKKSLLESYYARIAVLENFLNEFIPQYAEREIERHKAFFNDRSFDREQIEAIVKSDTYNLVIAGAGSGKTRVLTGRLAFLIEHGEAPDGILALAYTKSAEQEMRQRLRNDYGISNANVRTFHSLGRGLAKLSPKFRSDVADNTEQHKLIADSVRQLSSEDRGFALLLLDFAVDFRSRELERSKFPNVDKYYEYLRNQKYITLTGKEVGSTAERDIANFLFVNNVKFGYEIPVSWVDKDTDFRQYRPDFYMFEYGIWLEHWAIDRKGNVPPWFSSSPGGDASANYRRGMEWKRGQFKKHGHRLLETFHYQWVEGSLAEQLRRQLLANHVVLKELTREEILARVRDLIPREDSLDELMFSFINKAKTNGLTVDDIRSRLAQRHWGRKPRTFASLMIPVWERYESLLKENDMMDFSDMINCALQVAKQVNGQTPRFSHILIDEFQDITDPQLELIKCLLSSKPDSALFCVGDDRQNIFSFAGSNIYNILQFDESFPYPEKTLLPTNYRCPKNIVEASDVVANLNKFQLARRVNSASTIQRPMRLIEMPDLEPSPRYEEWELQTAKLLLEQLLGSKKSDEHVMVLSRTNQPLDRLKLEFPTHESSGLRFQTIHSAKGTEADYVLLLGCVSGRNGFPSEIGGQEALDIVKKNQAIEDDKLEEERRLFYVALTRCKNQFYLFTSREAKSQFVSEIRPYLFS
jgi:DNA helicase-4